MGKCKRDWETKEHRWEQIRINQMEEVKHKTKHMRHEMIKKEELTHTYVHVRNTHKTDTGT